MALNKTTSSAVTVSNFPADGGDKFSVLKADTNRVVGLIDLDALVHRIKGLPHPFSVPTQNRITRLN